MDIQQLAKINYSNQRVLTTKQLAEAYGCPVTNIKENFRRAKKRFTEGVDYFKVTGDALRDLKESVMDVLEEMKNCHSVGYHRKSPVADIADMQAQFAELQAQFESLQVTFAAMLDEYRKIPSAVERADKLIALADKTASDDDKDRIIRAAANLLAGKKIF